MLFFGNDMNTMKKIQRTYVFVLFTLLWACSANTEQSSNSTLSGSDLQVFQHQGIDREYLLYKPAGLKPDAPLLVVLHGFTSNARKIMDYTGFNKIADQNGFAVLYPQGLIDKEGNTFWNVGYQMHSNQSHDDVAFISSLIRSIQESHQLSKRNTFVAGMSNGGEMTYYLLCEHPSLFSAAAPIAATMLESIYQDCKPIKSVPILALFGTDDKITHWDGDMANRDGWGAYRSIPDIVQFWVGKMNLPEPEVDTLPDISTTDNSFVVLENYISKETKLEFRFYKVVNGGHDWPGAWGNEDFNTSQEIWNFFETYLK